MISNRQLDRMPPWTWESLVSFKQQFGETRGILQFFGTMFKRTKNATRKEKVKTTSALTTCCVLGSALLIETHMRMVYSMDTYLRVHVLRHVQFFCNPMDCNLPSSSVHGILQARILEWVAFPFFWGSSLPRNQTSISYVPCSGRRILYH